MQPLSAYLKALDSIVQPIRGRDWVFSLDPMHALMASSGDPQAGLRAVVVTGSSGKGSTCASIAHLLRANGLNVGLYTSPQLHSFRERFVFNERQITIDEFISGARIVREAADKLPHPFSTFESTTALALWWFAQQQPDIVVLEIGLGGRWDAVNVIENVLAVFTKIEDEHSAMLGGSLASVAAHKAGIIQPGGQALTVKQVPAVMAILQDEAADKEAVLRQVDESESLAVAACHNLHARRLIPRFEPPPTLDVLRLPGRLELVHIAGHRVLIDGGHTPEAARYLASEITRLNRAAPVRLIVGLLEDKKAQEFLRVFDMPQFHIVLTRAPSHRGADPDTLAARLELRDATFETQPNLQRALTQLGQADESLVVVAGSLRMAAVAREHFGLLDSDALDEAQATRVIFEGGDYLAKLPS